MRKLRMDLGELVVETFRTSSDEAERGTVAGHEGRPYNTAMTVCWGLCGTNNSDQVFCSYNNESCGGSCNTICLTCVSCDGTCPEQGCPTGWSCEGSTCAATCNSTCGETCGCTAYDTCNCV